MTELETRIETAAKALHEEGLARRAANKSTREEFEPA
jgi:hypothetical protein